ncbi:MAG: hypothetical protein KBF26_11730 [Opitutaceae bacterium]|nr:hypothetical protein [Opitutaceae bacterium]
MRPSRLAVFLWIGSLAGLVLAETPAPTPLLPERLTWVSLPMLPALHSAWLVGRESRADLYLLHVHLAAGRAKTTDSAVIPSGRIEGIRTLTLLGAGRVPPPAFPKARRVPPRAC